MRISRSGRETIQYREGSPDPAAAEGRPAPEGQASDKKGGPWELYWQLSLKDVGCSSSDKATVSYAEARDLPAFNWIATFVSAMMPSMAITLAITLAVYRIVRAIGWVLAALQRPS